MSGAMPLAHVRSTLRTSFVGRAAELAQLMRLLEEAAGGDARLAVIQGPAGIGKTRLAEELGARAGTEGARFGIGACWPDGEAPPLWPWRAILRELGGAETVLEKGGEAAADRFSLFQAALERLRRASGRGSLVAVVDDAHLADPATLLLARFLARARGLPLLLVLTRREGSPAAAPDLLAELCGEGVVLSLGGLPEDVVADYFDASGTPRPDPALLHAVAAVTGGNPLHLRSLAVHSELRAGVRGGLEHAIGTLLARMDAADRRVITVAALLGPEVAPLEVARVATASPAAVAEALARAGAIGLGQETAGGRFAFVHDLVRQTAMASLPAAERLDLHARAAELLAGHDQAQVSRRVHHALSAATRSREDAETAVRVAREAAAGLRSSGGLEPAAALMERAADIHAAAALPGPLARLGVEHAEAVLACGRLADARPLFQHAARVAEREGDAVSLGRSALGLAGVWLSEHRLADEAERVRALQRRALDALPADETVLRARLAARLAAEEAYRTGDVAPVLEGVKTAQRIGDPHALAEALSLAHHALLTPEHTWRRLPIAAELIAAAAMAGDDLLSLLGLCWQAVDLFLLGDARARVAFEELRVRADALRCLSVLYIVRSMEVMLAIRAGAFEEAERAAAAAYAMGREVGDADALFFHGAHVASIRYFQGREDEMAGMTASIAASPALIVERERTFGAAAALFALRAGDLHPAQALLHRLTRDGLASIPPSSSWLTTMLAVIEVASALGDTRVARAAYDALLPCADLPVMASMAVVCFGSAHRALGVAALAMDKADLAIEHFAAGLDANQQIGHRPAAIQCQAELALARLRHAHGGHDPRGRALLQQAIQDAEAAGMGRLAARWREAGSPEGVAAPPREEEPQAALMTLVPGGSWRVTLGDRVATVRDRVGMRHLARLVAAPDRRIPALVLVVNAVTEPAERGPDPVMDRAALRAVRDRIAELRARPTLSAAEQGEIDDLTRELARATGLGGRIRSFADAPERARTAVQKAVKRAIDEIAAADPAIGRHLARRVETGATCCYHLEGSD